MSHKENYAFKINNKYQLTEEDEKLIDSGQQTNKKWGSDHYKPFKDRIRAHLRSEQNGRCAFCRLWVNIAQAYSHLEHIVPKSKNPNFEFLPENLAFSCQKCNFSKGTKQTLTEPHIDSYPTYSGAFSIVNPYYDDYLEHIDFIEDILVIPKNNSAKGQKTIDFYKLYRTELAEARAFEAHIRKETSIKSLTVSMSRYNDKILLKRIVDLLEQIPKWCI